MTYEIVFKETLRATIHIKGKTRQDAIYKAKDYLAGGHSGWDSIGVRLVSCRPTGETKKARRSNGS